MLKSTNTGYSNSKKLTFPTLLQDESKTTILLAVDEDQSDYHGTVVYSDNSAYRLGEEGTYFDKSSFFEFKGEVILHNE